MSHNLQKPTSQTNKSRRELSQFWGVFWIYGILGNWIWWYVFSYSIIPFIENHIQPLYDHASEGFVDSKANAITAVIVPLLYLPYVIFSFVLLWKSSFKQPSHGLGVTVRSLLVLVTILLIGGGGFFWFIGVMLILNH